MPDLSRYIVNRGPKTPATGLKAAVGIRFKRTNLRVIAEANLRPNDDA